MNRMRLWLLLAGLGTVGLLALMTIRNAAEEAGRPPVPRERHGEEAMEWALAQSHHPYGAVLPVDVYQAMLDAMAKLPDEQEYEPTKPNAVSSAVKKPEKTRKP